MDNPTEEQIEQVQLTAQPQTTNEEKTKRNGESNNTTSRKKYHVNSSDMVDLVNTLAIAPERNYDTLLAVLASILSSILTNYISKIDIENPIKQQATPIIVVCVSGLAIILIIFKIIANNKEDKNTIISLKKTVNRIAGDKTHNNTSILYDKYGDIDYHAIYSRKKDSKPHKKSLKNLFHHLIPLIIIALPSYAMAQAAIPKQNHETIDIIAIIISLISLAFSSYLFLRSRSILNNTRHNENEIVNIKPDENPESLFQEGEKLYSNGNLNAAIEKFSAAIQIKPTPPQYYEKRADAYSQLGNNDQALEDYNHVLQLYSDDPINSIQTLNKIANIHYDIGNTIKAELYYSKAHDLIKKLNNDLKKSHFKEIVHLLNDYANLLLQQNKYNIAEELFTNAMNIIPEDPNNNQELRAMILNNLAILYKNTKQYKSADKEYNIVLSIYRSLAKQSPDSYLPDVAMTLNNLANLYSDTYQFQKAEKGYTEALSIYRQLATENADVHLPDVAMTLNNLANLHSDTNRYEYAEEEYTEALDIRRQLADDNPDAYLPSVANTLNNLATLHRDTNQLQAAETEYSEALSILRQLAEKSPDVYLSKLANTLNSMAGLYWKNNQFDNSTKMVTEALCITRELASKNPDAYLPKVAQTLNNLAILHSDTNRHEEAEAEYTEALTIYLQLAKKNPDAYLPYVAGTQNNLGALYNETNQYDEAEKKYTEALDIRRQLAKKNPDAYLPKVAQTLNNLAVLNKNTNRHEDAEKKYNEALVYYHQLAEKNPDAYLPDVAQTLHNMALLYRDKENLPAAEAAAQESLEKYHIMAEKSHAAFDPYVKKTEELLEDIQKTKDESGK